MNRVSLLVVILAVAWGIWQGTQGLRDQKILQEVRPHLTACVDAGNDENLAGVAEKGLQDVQNLLDYPNYTYATTFHDVNVTSTKIKGDSPDFALGGRSLFRVDLPLGRSAEDLYQFLISKEGYLLLDPDSDPNDFDQPLRPPIMQGSTRKIQLEYAHLPMPGIASDRDHVLVNVHDHPSRTFLSLTVNAPDLVRGLCGYGRAFPQKGPEGRIRMALFAAYRVTPLTHTTCMLTAMHWIDFLGWVPGTLSDIISAGYFRDFLERFQQAFPL